MGVSVAEWLACWTPLFTFKVFFLFSTFLVFVSVRWIKLTYVSFCAHVKKHLVSYQYSIVEGVWHAAVTAPDQQCLGVFVCLASSN